MVNDDSFSCSNHSVDNMQTNSRHDVTMPLIKKVKVKEKVKVKAKAHKNDKYDISNCPYQLHYFTKCLINDHIIDVYDSNIYNFNVFFEEIDSANIDLNLLNRCLKYTRDYCKRNKDSIGEMYTFFRFSLLKNLEKMEGYDERVQKWSEDCEKILKMFYGNN